MDQSAGIGKRTVYLSLSNSGKFDWKQRLAGSSHGVVGNLIFAEEQEDSSCKQSHNGWSA